MPNQPMAKKVLKRKRNRAATTPGPLPPIFVITAKLWIALEFPSWGITKRDLHDHGEGLAARTEHHELTSSKLLNREDCDPGRKEILWRRPMG